MMPSPYLSRPLLEKNGARLQREGVKMIQLEGQDFTPLLVFYSVLRIECECAEFFQMPSFRNMTNRGRHQTYTYTQDFPKAC